MFGASRLASGARRAHSAAALVEFLRCFAECARAGKGINIAAPHFAVSQQPAIKNHLDKKTLCRRAESQNDKQNRTRPYPSQMNLTIKEAAGYSTVAINKIDRMSRSPNRPFVPCVGAKTPVKGKALEDYVREKLVI